MSFSFFFIIILYGQSVSHIFLSPLVYPCSYMIAALLLAQKYFRDSAISLTLADVFEWNCIDAVGKFDL